MAKQDDFVKNLPHWAKTLASKYFSNTVSQFILHGAVHDYIPYEENQTTTYLTLPDFLEKVLFARRDFVLRYDRAKGLTFAHKDMARDFRNFLKATDTVTGSKHIASLPRDPALVLNLLERYIRIRIGEKKSLALVINYAETIVPQSEGGYMSDSDRSCQVTLRRWAHDPDFLAADVTVVLIAENLVALSSIIVRSPSTAEIEIPLPNRQERLQFIKHKTANLDWDQFFKVKPEALAELTAGLSRVHILQIINEATRAGQKITLNHLMNRKKELIESECYGLLEFFEPKYNLDMIAGHEAAKAEFRESARMLKQGRLDVLPMGYLVCGPVGTGKTFMVTCFTGEIGIPCVKILNIRSQWQGVTEANMQKILGIFKAMGPLGVIIDEADAFLGDRDAAGDSGTSSRIFSQIAEFMANTDYRGKIIWFLITCRPDLLPVDIKRQGRAEEHVALFHPQSEAERKELFQVFVKKNDINTRVQSVEKIYQKVGAPRLSGADIEAVVIRAKKRSAVKGNKSVTLKDFEEAFEEFVPPVYAEEVEYQTLVAVFECTNRKQIPSEYLDVPREALTQRLAFLRRYVD